jgi:hypothetical protein
MQSAPEIPNGSLSEQPISDRLTTVVALIKRTLKCEAVGIRLIDEDGNATYQVQDGFPDEFSATCQSVSLYRDDCVCTRLLNSKSGPGASFYNEREPFMAGSACEFRSVLLCRIFCTDMNLGLIHCADTRPQRFSPQSAQFLEDLAETVGRSLFYDSLWLPAAWVRRSDTMPSRAVCSICGKHRDDRGRWFAERRRKPRISWSVLRLRRVVCPHCLQFSTVE